MFRQNPSCLWPISSALLVVTVLAGPASAAVPLSKATVTKVENVVNYGEVKGGHTSKRPAVAEDVVRPNNFLLSETDSRAELKYEDGTVVRIGQNTVFSFDAATRTLTLEKGSLIFYIPKGAGGGTIKTPSLTAAITGTVGKVSDNLIAILDGEVKLLPSGRPVGTGQFARKNADGSITVAPFDLAKAFEGKLMSFNGPMPGFDDKALTSKVSLAPNLSFFDALERTQDHFVMEEKKQEKKQKKEATPPPTPEPPPPTPIRRVTPKPTPDNR